MGFDYSQGQEIFLYVSIPGSLFPHVNLSGWAKLANHLYLVLMLRIHRTIYPLPSVLFVSLLLSTILRTIDTDSSQSLLSGHLLSFLHLSL